MTANVTALRDTGLLSQSSVSQRVRQVLWASLLRVSRARTKVLADLGWSLEVLWGASTSRFVRVVGRSQIQWVDRAPGSCWWLAGSLSFGGHVGPPSPKAACTITSSPRPESLGLLWGFPTDSAGAISLLLRARGVTLGPPGNTRPWSCLGVQNNNYICKVPLAPRGGPDPVPSLPRGLH